MTGGAPAAAKQLSPLVQKAAAAALMKLLLPVAPAPVPPPVQDKVKQAGKPAGPPPKTQEELTEEQRIEVSSSVRVDQLSRVCETNLSHALFSTLMVAMATRRTHANDTVRDGSQPLRLIWSPY